jgi:hypothetical protein
MTIPVFYPNNVDLQKSDTTIVRGNRVSNCTGSSLTGIRVTNCAAIRASDNQVNTLNSAGSIAYLFMNSFDTVICNNTASRCYLGIYTYNVLGEYSIYNATIHNCSTHFYTNKMGVYRNIALSAYEDWSGYNTCYGFINTSPSILSVDYLTHFGLGTVYSGNVSIGTNVTNEKPLYMNEVSNDLTPDPISNLVHTGTANPITSAYVDRGGVSSGIEDETTIIADTFYQLLDNTFWDIDNPQAPEVSFIKAYQSRILGNCELAVSQVYNNAFLKLANSSLAFSDMFPTYARYQNSSRFMKRVMDLWYGTQNPATLYSYNTGIGGYSTLPSFFTRAEDINDGWIVATSDVDIDNWLMGEEDIKYGIVIDMLGTSTISRGTSAECYSNVQHSISDVAPVRWNLHNEAQPTNYYLSTNMWNGFEQYTLSNMEYDEDYCIRTSTVPGSGSLITEAIPTASISLSGYTELSVLDRIFSENIVRTVYYREGDGTTWGSWVEIESPISGYISLGSPYIQVKIDVSGVLRKIDYQYIGICCRPYQSARIWTALAEDEMAFVEFVPGTMAQDPGGGVAVISDQWLVFSEDASYSGMWSSYIPTELRNKGTKTLRISGRSPAGPGTALFVLYIVAVDSLGTNTLSILPVFLTVNNSTTWSYVDVDLSTILDSTQVLCSIYLNRNAPGSGGFDTLAGDFYFAYALIS